MYESFFGFERPPFNNTPDTSFFFPSDQHNEALAQLVYTITAKKGFAVLTGEIGAGKTTLCRNLLRQLDEETTRTAIITNPRLTGIQLLYAVAKEFGIEVKEIHRIAILEAINEFLVEMLAQDQRVVLIIDEAQNLPLATLEEVRLISNLETETEKLIQILLLGQPELRAKLEHPSLVQLRQRVAMRFHLGALSEEDTGRYIEHRMALAGKNHKARFSSRGVSTVYRYSGGVPRLINLLCDRVLITAYTAGVTKIGAKEVMDAIHDIEGPDWTFKKAKGQSDEGEGRRPFFRLPFFAQKSR